MHKFASNIQKLIFSYLLTFDSWSFLRPAPRFRFASSRSRHVLYSFATPTSIPLRSISVALCATYKNTKTHRTLCEHKFYTLRPAPRFRFAPSRSRHALYINTKNHFFLCKHKRYGFLYLCRAYLVPNIRSPASPKPGTIYL